MAQHALLTYQETRKAPKAQFGEMSQDFHMPENAAQIAFQKGKIISISNKTTDTDAGYAQEPRRENDISSLDSRLSNKILRIGKTLRGNSLFFGNAREKEKRTIHLADGETNARFWRLENGDESKAIESRVD